MLLALAGSRNNLPKTEYSIASVWVFFLQFHPFFLMGYLKSLLALFVNWKSL